MDNLDRTTPIGIWFALTQGKHTIIDREDHEKVSRYAARRLHGEFARTNFPEQP